MQYSSVGLCLFDTQAVGVIHNPGDVQGLQGHQVSSGKLLGTHPEILEFHHGYTNGTGRRDICEIVGWIIPNSAQESWNKSTHTC